jgi:hypothetical protein
VWGGGGNGRGEEVGVGRTRKKGGAISKLLFCLPLSVKNPGFQSIEENLVERVVCGFSVGLEKDGTTSRPREGGRARPREWARWNRRRVFRWGAIPLGLRIASGVGLIKNFGSLFKTNTYDSLTS